MLNKTIVITTAVLLSLSAGTNQVSAQKTTTAKKINNKQATKKSTKSVTGTPGQFPESSDRLLTAEDLEHRTPWGLRVMQNEIYARHGYIFKDATMRKHFRKEKWYKGKEKNFNNIKLTETEIQNIAFIKAHQPNAKH